MKTLRQVFWLSEGALVPNTQSPNAHAEFF